MSRILLRGGRVVDPVAGTDTTADVLAGQRAELGTILVKTGQGGDDGQFQVDPHFVEDDLFDAIARVNQFEYSLRV